MNLALPGSDYLIKLSGALAVFTHAHIHTHTTYLQLDCASWQWVTSGGCRHYPQTQTPQQAELQT